jgi:cytochrome c biogenesis protein CcmG/thiol:disulfide interchange protein DsbE
MKKEHLMMAVALVVVFGAALFFYSRWKSGESAPHGQPGASAPTAGAQMAPAFTLTDVKGETFDSAAMADKPAVINFFATWCPPCRGEIPGFVEVYEKYKGQGFVMVGISVDTDTRDKLPAFIEEQRISYPVLLGGDGSTAKAYGGVSAIPTTFFVGRDGAIRNVHVGFMDKAAFDQEVAKLFQ